MAAADGEGGGSGGEKQAGFLKAAASQPKEQRPQLDTQPADDDAFILWLGQKVRLAGSLRPRFDKNPKDMLILLGPANCGKTKTASRKATRPLPYKPVIIIDEANKLMRWSDDPGHIELKNLLDFFVRTTKQEHLGHFVLASSESFVIDFLEKEGLHTKQYVTQEIGDLATIDEAKQFVESLMLCKKAPSSFFDTTENGEQIDMWPRVYEICGGNIGLLERCGEYANDIGSWEAGFEMGKHRS
ncbi:hypothetical protein KSW81_006159 [Nannochloris sp. 'desiccata']|nr:hypothetical protein KSW81_006159 [Chlorella desiccata (nom. nud.)]